MPPADEPLVRLHARAHFADVLLDMYLLFEGVRGMGGYEHVCRTRSWRSLKGLMHIQPTVNSFGTQLRKRYERLVLPDRAALAAVVESVYERMNMCDESWAFLQVRGCTVYEAPTGDDDGARKGASPGPGKKASPGPGKEASPGPGKEASPGPEQPAGVSDEPEATCAAFRARMSPHFLSEEEQSHPLFVTFRPSLTQLDLRLHIVRLWYRDVRRRLSVYEAMKDVPLRFHGLGVAVFCHLEMSGAINFGALPLSGTADLRAVLKETCPFSQKHIAVVGAGLAGIAAARHLQMYGVKVTVLEAHQFRAGGRIFTEKGTFSAPVDVGAMLLCGERQNPLAVIAKQCGANMTTVQEEVPIYDVNGSWVDKNVEQKANAEFTATLEATCAFRKKEGALRPELHTMSFGTLWQKMLEHRAERKAAGQFRNHLRAAGRRAHPVVEVKVRLPAMDAAFVARENHERQMKSRVFRWLIAALEATCGADIGDMSLMDSDPAGENAFAGDDVLLPGGFGEIVDALKSAKEIGPILFDSNVIRVTNHAGGRTGGERRRKSGVTITTMQSFGAPACDYFDGVILTVPLGVLKSGHISFEPPLSEEKVAAIQGLGVSGLVKVVLEFEYNFWGIASSFGALHEDVDKRGEFFFFWNLNPALGKPILISVVAEPSARLVEYMQKKDVVAAAMEVLRRKYPDAPDPIESLVTQWCRDDLSRGISSYVPAGESSRSYETIAEPVDDVIFFAGEHTAKSASPGAAAALLSGYREAWNVLSAMGLSKFVVEAYSAILLNKLRVDGTLNHAQQLELSSQAQKSAE